MKFILILCLSSMFLSGCSTRGTKSDFSANLSTQKPPPLPRSAWIQQSDELAEAFTRSWALLRPEVGSEIGFAEYNSKGLLMDNQTDQRDQALFREWISRLKAEQPTVQDRELKTDREVLRNWLQNRVDEFETARKLSEIEFNSGVRFIYQNLQSLLNDQADQKTKKAAVDRFRIYVQGDENHRPLLQALTDVFKFQRAQMAARRPLWPYRGEVEQYLKDSPAITIGVKELLEKSGRSDWKKDFADFQNQSREYDDFVREEILPHTRPDPRVPLEMYSHILKRRGILRSPQELITTGLRDYRQLYVQFQKQARKVAHKRNLKKSDAASVIQSLKMEAISKPEEVESLYKAVGDRLERIMKEHDLISVPSEPLRIRIASEAESRLAPVPHLNVPPLINNNSERPEFVVPSSAEGLPFDDFASPHAAVVLTAHEGRPGHDMQFSQMLDQGISVIRGRYAANNVNVEGWALYAEDLVYPFLTAEEQLFALQTRLWRMARMFLDPQIQLGLIPDQRVLDLFTKELGVSAVMAQLELQRYKYQDVGQAPSYYEGYLQVKDMLREAQKKRGPQFSLKCFNDQFLSYGLLPLQAIAERMRNEITCPGEGEIHRPLSSENDQKSMFNWTP